MDLSIITIVYHPEKEMIADQIRSVVRAAKGLTFEHFIVDNASHDGTAEYIKANFPHIILLQNEVNQGFARPNNRALAQAQAPFILFLNPDMKFLHEGDLKTWLDWMKARSRVGISCCKLVDTAGNINMTATPRRFPYWYEILLILLKLPHIFPQLLSSYLYRDLDFSKEQSVDSVRGSCMLMRRELTDTLGWGFDPRYFFWYEDVDVCREAKRLGYDVVHTPIISCVDYVGQTFKLNNFFWKQTQLIKSVIKYLWKWGLKRV